MTETILEEWKVIKGCSNYSISSCGKIKNNMTNKILKQQPNPKGYLSTNIKTDDSQSVRYGIHRLMGLHFLDIIDGKTYVDHIDRNKQNNVISNLRWVTNAENIRNQNKRNGCSSKHKGVSFDKNRNKWTTKIKINYKTKNLGRYETEEEAALAYNNFIIENTIEGAILNSIP